MGKAMPHYDEILNGGSMDIDDLNYAELWFSKYGIPYEDYDGGGGCMTRPKVKCMSKLCDGSVVVTGTLDYADESPYKEGISLKSVCNHSIPEPLGRALGKAVANNFEALMKEALKIMRDGCRDRMSREIRSLEKDLRKL